jgi:hypothetical protein
VAGTEEKNSEANPAEISNSFRLGRPFFIRQIRNLNQNRVEGCRNVPLGLLLLPLGTRGGNGLKKKKKESHLLVFPQGHGPTNLLTRLQQRFA